MYEDEPSEEPAERASDPAERAREKADEFRMHAELCAVFEGPRKFDAAIRPTLDPQIARDSQKTIARLEKARSQGTPLLEPPASDDAAALLDLPNSRDLPTGDYHVYRRPGEVMILRWLHGDDVDAFYTRMQAHFDAAITACREEERHSQAWKQDPQTIAYLDALDAIQISMADRYLRNFIRQHNLFVLSTQSADEMDILHLTDTLMGVGPADLVGTHSAPPDTPTEQDRAWFFKLFSLRGMKQGQEQLFFFVYLQKSDDTF